MPRGFSVIDIGKQVGRSSVDRNRIKRWRGGRRRSSGAVVENSGRRVYYLSFLTRPGNGEETKVTRTRMETEAKRRNNETLPRLYGEFNFIRRLTATTRTFRREFRLSSPPAVNIFIAVVISPTNDSRDWNTSFDSKKKEEKDRKSYFCSIFFFHLLFFFLFWRELGGGG